jgi:hypothetical protein
MSAGGAMPAGSGRSLRLDPLALPVRFRTGDASADESTRVVELYHDRVIVRRSIRGARMALSLPTSCYLGVAVRLTRPADVDAGSVAVMLEHRDPALSVPLFVATDCLDVLAEWRLWAGALDVPLLIADDDGVLHEATARLGAVEVGQPSPRLRRRTPVIRRRPRILMRRKPGHPGCRSVHREREIIARN